MSFKYLFVILCVIKLCNGNLLLPNELFWDGGSMLFPSNSIRKLYIESGKYTPKNIIATKGVIKNDKLILLTSRCKRGVPASLVELDRFNMKDPKFVPYPNLALHEEGKCNAIQNAVDMFLDQRGLLWILDIGIVETMEAPRKLCDPKVICISSMTGRIERTIDISNLTVSNSSRLQHIVVQYENYRNPHLFISDAPNRAILMYDVQNSRGSKIILPTKVAPVIDPQDVLYLAVTKTLLSEPVLYINYLSSPELFALTIDFLNTGKSQGKIRDVGKADGPVIFLGTNTQSKIFFRYNNKPEIYSWDTTREFSNKTIKSIYKSSDCFFPTSVFQDCCSCFKVLESNFEDFLKGTVGCGVVHQITDLLTNDIVSRL